MSEDGEVSGAERLARLKAEQCETARDRILEGDLDQASACLHKAELIARLARVSGPRSRPIPAVAIGLIGLSVLLVLATWKLKVTRFLDLQVSIRGWTTATQFTLASPTTIESFRGAAVDVGRIGSLSAQIIDIPDQPSLNRWVRVSGARVEVRGLHAAAGTQLDFALTEHSSGAKALALRSHGSELAGELLVLPGAVVSTGIGDEQASPGSALPGDVSDVVSFGCENCVDVPFRLDVRGVEPFIFGNVPVRTLAFSEDHAQPDGTVYFTSGLRGGSIRLLDVDRTESIERGDGLKLDIARTRRFEISYSAKDDALSFVFEGSANAILLGPVGAEKELSPSLLEYFYRQKSLALLWGGAVFLWGLFVGVRKLWQGVGT